MKKCKKGIMILLTLMMSLAMLSGCGAKELDAEAAVDAYLRAELQGDIDDYAELLGRDKEDVQEEYDTNIDDMMEMFAEVEVLGGSFTDDFPQAVKDVLASAKYEITGSEKDDDGNYTVDVTVYPSDVFDIFYEKTMEAAVSAEDTSDIGGIVLQALKDAMDEQTFGDGEVHQVRIDYDEDEKLYEFNEDDTTELMEAFFATEDTIEQLYEPTGTVYDNEYLNWTKTEWEAASEEERTQCCLALVQEMQGLTDEEMAMIDLNDETIQQGIQQMKDGLDLSFENGMNVSIGDYAAIVQGETGAEE
ncbi:hypothetical protein OCV99_14425 [Dorea acetigenes]|uniref:DUF5105 domain-containing protein n=1 Tax=Dorea acetigenes TaxID=2981787 RepID=A0ABT2RQK2_9FIRM|nr:hypothetical protein [Dorea acetigenes]MCU6687704.1 hypothetical protein [Dorea acetigenes]SCJ52997.1 Uncharacterised protein [uncultured Clostridium sp.]